MFYLGNASRAALTGVHPKLVSVVEGAIKITKQDFGVYEGLRSKERQRKLVNAGMSKTMNSMHITQTDGWGHAVDLVPYIDGQLRWEWGGCYTIACAMDEVSTQLGVKLVWGGCWDRDMSQYGLGTPISMKEAVEAYCKRHPGPDFIDGPHYQLG